MPGIVFVNHYLRVISFEIARARRSWTSLARVDANISLFPRGKLHPHRTHNPVWLFFLVARERERERERTGCEKETQQQRERETYYDARCFLPRFIWISVRDRNVGSRAYAYNVRATMGPTRTCVTYGCALASASVCVCVCVCSREQLELNNLDSASAVRFATVNKTSRTCSRRGETGFNETWWNLPLSFSLSLSLFSPACSRV